MLKLHSVDLFPPTDVSVVIDTREPQQTFSEHYHDFYEIVIVEKGHGLHVFNGEPYMLSGGSVCFVRDHDHHLYEHTENLVLKNVCFRSPDTFSFLEGMQRFLPQEQNGHYQGHKRLNHRQLQNVKQHIDQMLRVKNACDLQSNACREVHFMQLLMLLHKGHDVSNFPDAEERMNLLIVWLEEHYAEEIHWEELADRFTLPLRTIQRHLKNSVGLTPQKYLNRLRLMHARHQLRHSNDSVIDIALQCGFDNSNYFSTLFRSEFDKSPSEERTAFLQMNR